MRPLATEQKSTNLPNKKAPTRRKSFWSPLTHTYTHLLDSGIPEDHIIRFAFDSADDLQKTGESLLQIQSKNKKADPEKFVTWVKTRICDEGMYFLLLDEVQMLGSFEAVLNGYLRRDNMDIYVTGSNAKFLSSDIITEFACRGASTTSFRCA